MQLAWITCQVNFTSTQTWQLSEESRHLKTGKRGLMDHLISSLHSCTAYSFDKGILYENSWEVVSPYGIGMMSAPLTDRANYQGANQR